MEHSTTRFPATDGVRDPSPRALGDTVGRMRSLSRQLGAVDARRSPENFMHDAASTQLPLNENALHSVVGGPAGEKRLVDQGGQKGKARLAEKL